MRLITVMCVLFSLAVHSTRAADDVLVIKGEKDFKELLKANPFIVVEFYAPWCGHCKSLEPEYAKAAAMLKSSGIALAKLDATAKENDALKSKFQIKGFPTLKIFKNGKEDSPIEYTGPRQADGIVTYLKKQAQPATLILSSKDDTAALLKTSDIAALAFFDKNTTDDFKAFAEVADVLRADIDFAYTTDTAILDSHCEKDCSSPYLLMVKKGEKIKPKYEGKFTVDLLKPWVESHSTPLVAKFGSDAGKMKHFQKAFGAPIPKFIVVTKEADEEAATDVLTEAAIANDKLKFILTTAKEGGRLIDYFGLTKDESKYPVFLIFDDQKAEKFLKESAKVSDAAEFIKEYNDGALKPFVKSEEAPKDNNGPVTIVTANTFNDVIFSGEKDVFVEFYAPWCGHCKKLTPIWEELGEKYKDADVVIAKMDSTANDIPTPKIKVTGFPTLVWVTKSGETNVYSGGRELADLSKFVNEKLGIKEEEKKKEEEEKEEDGHDEL
jgi:protein disulfide-isomerase A1